jgi:hypothetical protein
LKFSGSEFCEIRFRGPFEALLTVNRLVDFGIRKNEAILGRLILQASDLTHLKKAGGFLLAVSRRALRAAWRDCSSARFF